MTLASNASSGAVQGRLFFTTVDPEAFKITDTGWHRRPGRSKRSWYCTVAPVNGGHEQTWSRKRFNRDFLKYVREEDLGTPVQETPVEQPVQQEQPSVLDGTLAELIAKAVQPYVQGTLDEEQVVQLIDERLGGLVKPNLVEVKTLDGETKEMGLQHPKFEAILRCVQQRMHIWLAGPAGSGKTTTAAAVAKALDLPFYCTSVCAQTSEAKLMGYNNVSDGSHVRSLLREAYEFGGVFLLDEADAGTAGILTVINQCMSNPQVGFQDAVVERHPDFVVIACANTYGSGANRQYVGRNQLDAATLDRFVFMEYGYDSNIEASMCGVPAATFGYSNDTVEFADTSDADSVQKRCVEACKQIAKYRTAVQNLRVRHIISPRAAMNTCKMIRSGFPTPAALDMAVWKGLDGDTVQKVREEAA